RDRGRSVPPEWAGGGRGAALARARVQRAVVVAGRHAAARSRPSRWRHPDGQVTLDGGRPMTDKPSRNEEEYFARRDAELLRQQLASAQQAAAQAERRSHSMKCPKCGYDLITGEWHGVEIDQCTHCHGLWFDAGEAESLLDHEDRGIFSRVFRAVLKGVSGARASDT